MIELSVYPLQVVTMLKHIPRYTISTLRPTEKRFSVLEFRVEVNGYVTEQFTLKTLRHERAKSARAAFAATEAAEAAIAKEKSVVVNSKC